MLSVYINAVGLAAPGLPTWNDSQAILCGKKPYVASELEKYKPLQLPPNERRRATELVRIAFRVCEDMMNNSQVSMRDCASVFASSGGDYPIIDQICKALCEEQRLVSPTQFHNSVHNSAAGYWGIATESQLASASISAYDYSFNAGLLEAASLCCSENLYTILAVYDIKPPAPIDEKRNITTEFGAAFLLSPQKTAQSMVKLSINNLGVSVTAASVSSNSELEQLRLSNPAARTLPLLELIARKESGQIYLLGANNAAVQVDVSPCN